MSENLREDFLTHTVLYIQQVVALSGFTQRFLG